MLSKMLGEKLEEMKMVVIRKAAQGGDKMALQLIKEIARPLGIGIANLVNLFNTKTIIIGGQLVYAGEILLEPVRKIVEKRAYAAATHNVRIIATQLGEEVYVVGAVALALSFIFTDPELIEESKEGTGTQD